MNSYINKVKKNLGDSLNTVNDMIKEGVEFTSMIVNDNTKRSKKEVFSSYQYKTEAKIQNVNLYIKENIHTISDSDIYVTPNIPEKKLNNAIKAFKCEDFYKTILAIYDNTLFGSATEGLIFTGEKMVFNNGELFVFPYKDIQSIDCKVEYEIKNGKKTKSREYILILMNDNEYKLENLSKINHTDFLVMFDKIVKNSYLCHEECQSSLQLHELKQTSEKLKSSYLKIIINMTFSDDGVIDDKELAEIFLLMTKFELAKETRFELREYISNIDTSIESIKNLLLIIDDEIAVVYRKSIKLSIVKDLINVYLSTKKDINIDSFEFIKDNQDILNITNDEIEFAFETIKIDHQILNENMTDDMIEDKFKSLVLKAENLGISSTTLYISSSVIGLSAPLLFVPLVAVAGLGYGAYRGTRYLVGENELDRYKKRELMLHNIIKQNQKTITLIIDDINFVIEKLNDVISNHKEQSEKIQKLMSIMQSFQGALTTVDNKSNSYEISMAKLKCPEVLDIEKLNRLTSDIRQKHIFEFVVNCYDEKLVEENGEEYMTYLIKESLNLDTLDELAQILESIEYFHTENIATNGFNKVKGFFG